MDTKLSVKCRTCRRVHFFKSEELQFLGSCTCACGENLLPTIMLLTSPRTAFLKKAIKARQLACELRSILEELDTDIREIELEESLAFTEDECSFEDLAASIEHVEGILDGTFDSKVFPSSDPLTWKEQP